MKKILILVFVLVSCSVIASYDAQLSEFNYPFEVHVMKFETQNQKLEMAYMDVRPVKANGEVIVLLHGKNFAGYYWKTTIDLLVSKGFRVIVPDQIGFGKSSKPQTYQFTFQSLASNTQKLLADLKIKNVSVVGHSMGGMLATRFALMYPSTVEKLILVNPIGLEDWKKFIPYQSIDEVYAHELKTTPESIREYQKMAYYDGQWKPEYETLIHPQAEMTKSPDFARVAWNSALTYDMLFTQPVLYEFSDLKVSTLLIIGQRDRTAPGKNRAPKHIAGKLGDYPALGKKAAKMIKGSKLVEIKKSGHVPQVEAFDEYAKALLNFLK